MNSASWLITFVLLLILEIFTLDVITVWFVIGTFAAFITSLLTDSFLLQVVVFVVVSVLSLIIINLFTHKKGTHIKSHTNSDRVIGKIGEVTKKISEEQYGEVNIFGNNWTACSNHTIPVGKKVRVLKNDGLRLFVEEES